jgi:hypothetical protein
MRRLFGEVGAPYTVRTARAVHGRPRLPSAPRARAACLSSRSSITPSVTSSCASPVPAAHPGKSSPKRWRGSPGAE